MLRAFRSLPTWVSISRGHSSTQQAEKHGSVNTNGTAAMICIVEDTHRNRSHRNKVEETTRLTLVAGAGLQPATFRLQLSRPAKRLTHALVSLRRAHIIGDTRYRPKKPPQPPDEP